MAKGKYLTIDELLGYTEPVWLYAKGYGGGWLIPTAVQVVRLNDFSEPYSVEFYSGNVFMIGTYGRQWWAVKKKPTDKQVADWGGLREPTYKLIEEWGGLR